MITTGILIFFLKEKEAKKKHTSHKFTMLQIQIFLLSLTVSLPFENCVGTLPLGLFLSRYIFSGKQSSAL